MTDDRSDPDTAAPQGSGRKKRPPVIELKATDVTPEKPAKADTEETSAQPQEESPERPQAAAKDASPAGKDPGSHSIAILAGVTGALAGALVLSLVFLFMGEGVKQPAAAPETAAVSPGDMPAAGQPGKTNAEYEKRLAALEDRKPPGADLAPLAARLDRVEKALGDLRHLVAQTQSSAAAASEALAGRIAALESSLKQSARSSAANNAEIVALGVLRDAIVKGVPFTKELRAVRAMLGDGAASLTPLERSAGKGLATAAALRAQFAALAPKLVQEKSRTEGGYFSRLASSMSRLIEVRPVGEAQGTSAGAVTARIETRLAKNDLAAALDEAAQLPASAKTAAAAWIESATSRRDAELAVNNLLNAALARSAAKTETQP